MKFKLNCFCLINYSEYIQIGTNDKGGTWMKYIVKMEVQKNEFPSDYRRLVISFFKKAISSYMNGAFYEDLYESGARKKSLVWSIGFKNPQFSGETIFLEEKEVELTLKIADAETALIYYTSLLEMKGKNFPLPNGNMMKLNSIRMVKEKVINGDMALFKILSPICLKQHLDHSNKDWYVSIGSEDFALELQRKLIEDYPERQADVERLLFNFDGLKRVIVRAYGLKIPATIGTMVIQGKSDILNMILTNGIGSKRNSGFGLVDVIEQ